MASVDVEQLSGVVLRLRLPELVPSGFLDPARPQIRSFTRAIDDSRPSSRHQPERTALTNSIGL
jgi:hypothetical protein